MLRTQLYNVSVFLRKFEKYAKKTNSHLESVDDVMVLQMKFSRISSPYNTKTYLISKQTECLPKM